MNVHANEAKKYGDISILKSASRHFHESAREAIEPWIDAKNDLQRGAALTKGVFNGACVRGSNTEAMIIGNLEIRKTASGRSYQCFGVPGSLAELASEKVTQCAESASILLIRHAKSITAHMPHAGL